MCLGSFERQAVAEEDSCTTSHLDDTTSTMPRE